MLVSFFGVRGSTPCCSDELHRYGGNTSCVVLEAPDEDPLILDLGTGLRFFGITRKSGDPFRGTALVSHLHWDHVQGLPFFAPVLAVGAALDIFAPSENDRSARAAFDTFMAPPFFPVGIDALPGKIRVMDMPGHRFAVGGWEVEARMVPHVGKTFGFRISKGGRSVAYIPDHQQPGSRATHVDPEVLALCAGVDLLIHDAQFDDDEFELKSDWGHCTVAYAVRVAAEAGAKSLALFHHDPSHTDARIDDLHAGARALGTRIGMFDIIAAAEGMAISLEPMASALGSVGAPRQVAEV